MPERDIVGMYLSDIRDIPLLTAEEEGELFVRIASGDQDAHKCMVRANLRLVVNIARSSRYKNRGLSLEDLIGEGNLGLIRSVKGFDPAVGIRFYIYASYQIKQAIFRALIEKGTTIRVPMGIVNLVGKWKHVATRLAAKLERPPTEDEIGAELSIKKVRIARVRDGNRQRTGFFNESGTNILDFQVDPRSSPSDSQLEYRDWVESVLGALTRLGDRDALVLKMRYGLGLESPMTLKEVGEHLGLTGERIRQIESKALRKLTAELSDGDE